MTYRDIVLKLLKNRRDVICLEEHLMNDFKNNNGDSDDFTSWCFKHGIEFAKLESDENPKIQLTIKENNN